MILLTAVQWAGPGLLVYWLTLVTAKAMSGLETTARYRRDPTTAAKLELNLSSGFTLAVSLHFVSVTFGSIGVDMGFDFSTPYWRSILSI